MATSGSSSIGLRAFKIRENPQAVRKSESGGGGAGIRTDSLLEHVFGKDPWSYRHENNEISPEKQLGLHNLSSYLDTCLQKVEDECISGLPSASQQPGVVGPQNVIFDVNGSVGVLLVEPDRLGVSSHSNFSSVRANACVYKGKFAYELMIGSKGVMQLGWCTVSCKFSQEEGVGDTENSYAYDGSRLRKWNVRTVKYGEPWLTGDVITCTIDCDAGLITFYRNGKCMGDAFTDVKLGPGMAYFPAVSLSFGENLRANYGATPLRYPVKGFETMQSPPLVDLAKAKQLFLFLERLLPSLVDADEQVGAGADFSQRSHDLIHEERSIQSTLLLITAHLFDKLAPLLTNAYIVESCLLPFLQSFCDTKDPFRQPMVTKTMHLLWTYMQEFELKPCLENLILSLQCAYRFSVVSVDFINQQQYLSITLALLQHGASRKFLLKNILFDKVKLPVFLHVKPPDDSGLLEMIPTVWWPTTKKKDSITDELSTEEEKRKDAYYSSCLSLGQKVSVLENIQVEILKELLIDTDGTDGPSSRSVFLQKFREFLKENHVQTGSRVLTNKCPLPLSLCFFHRLVRALGHYWSEFAVNNPDIAVPSSEAFVPCVRFLDDTIDYFDFQRIGGLISHLRKAYKDEIAKLTEKTVLQMSAASMARSKPSKEEETEKLLEKLRVIDPAQRREDQAPSSKELASAVSLVELLDGAIVLYNIAAHKQLSKMSSLREMLNEYVAALEDTEKKISECPPEMLEVLEELERARTVFQEKVTEQARHMSWVIAVTYAKDKQEDVHWLLQAILTTIERSSKQDHLFSFMPEFYIDVCISASVALKSYFPPTLPFESLEGSSKSIHRLALFFSQHFADPRIVNTDVKDTIVQALACFVCYPVSLKALEDMPLENRQHMVKCLLAPYEKRSWAHTNWVLVRLWKGCGFAFRYTHLPHLLPTKNQQQEIANASLQTPCPSLLFQQHTKEFLTESLEGATKLIDSLLNQLNWAFSEFVGMLQELQQISSRPQATYVDSRIFKICATCFDISVGLLRVLEMLTSTVPELLTDWSKPSAEVLLARLFQLLTQVLNRITARTSLFENIVSQALPDLETVDYFSILAAVTGILVNLLLKGDPKSIECSTAAILAEPGFQESSLEFLLGGSTGLEAAAAPTGREIFSFNKYKSKEVSEIEIEEVHSLITYLRIQRHKNKAQSPDIEEEQMCSICYARPKTALFKPCGHQSCKSCISHQLMTKKECFFCKAEVEEVVDHTGSPFKFS